MVPDEPLTEKDFIVNEDDDDDDAGSVVNVGPVEESVGQDPVGVPVMDAAAAISLLDVQKEAKAVGKA